MWSALTEFLTGTAGSRGTAASAAGAPSWVSAVNVPAISAGTSPTATVLLLTCAATMSAVNAIKSACGIAASFMSVLKSY